VPVGEVTLNVACQGSGPIALLLHGWPEYHGTWSKLAPPLVKLGYRVIMPDQRGYNTSDKPDGVDAYGIDHLVGDILGLLDQIGKTERVLLVAHDWGGLLAWVVAHRNPERLRALVVMGAPHPDTWNRPEVDPVQAMAANNYVPLITAEGGESVIDLADVEIGPHVTSAELDGYHKAWNQSGAKVAMNNWYRANAYPENRLPTGITVDTKTLLFWGAQDNYCTSSQLSYIPNFVSDLTVQTYPDVDHWIQLQKTDDIIMRIDAFDASR
jgi:pimeloyl-ACP methyl ester carboxylesterase